MSALRLYQEEKVQRQEEAARAEQLLTQLKELQRAALAQQQKQTVQRNTITTDLFVAELRGLGLAPPIPSPSLTWHCLAMSDLVTEAPDVLAILHPTSVASDIDDTTQALSARGDVSMDHIPFSPTANGSKLPSDVSEDIENLTKRLQQLEAEAEAAKRSVNDNKRLVSDLKSKLDASTATCQNLMQTVEDQRETIVRLS